jgi:CheY-like chemotaxis protein
VCAFERQDEALEALRDDPGGFDVVVTDFNMPGMSGLEVVRAVRAIAPDMPVAMASGYITDELRDAAAAAGVREVIFKPHFMTELEGVIDKLTGSAQAAAA